jgi:hypothetical protein
LKERILFFFSFLFFVLYSLVNYNLLFTNGFKIKILF